MLRNLVACVALALALLALCVRTARAQDPGPGENPTATAAEPTAAPPPAEPTPTAPSTVEPAATEAPAVPSAAPGEPAGEAVPKPSDEGDISAADEKAADDAAATHDPAKYAEVLRSILPHVRETVRNKLEEKMTEKAQAKLAHLTVVLACVSMGGWLLLLMPLFLAKKHPGKMGVLFKFSALAAVSAVVTLLLFAGVVLLIKGVQSVAARQANPAIIIVEATIDTIDDEAEDLIDMGPSLIQPTLDQMDENPDQVLPVALLDNVTRIAKDAQPFVSAANTLRGCLWVLEYVPIVTTCIAILLFVLGARPILKELAALPGKAAAGGADAAGIVKQAFAFVGRELIAALGLVTGVMVLSLLSAETMAMAIAPAVHDLMNTFFENVRYVQVPDASTSLMFWSLVLAVLSLGLSALLVILASSFYLGKLHKILQARVHQKVPLGTHKKFSIWGTIGMAFTMLFPFLYALGAKPLLDMIEDKAFAKGEDPSWTFVLLSGGLVMVVGFLAVFWATRGMKGLLYILKYKPLPVPPKAAAA